MTANKKTFNQAVKDLTSEVADLVISKQRDYGKGNIVNPLFDAKIIIAIRLSDKIARLANLIQSKAKPENETLQDTVNDIIGYGVVLRMVLDDTFNLPLEPQVDEKEVSKIVNDWIKNIQTKVVPYKSNTRAITTAEKELVINRLRAVWIKNKDLRLGQLIGNVFEDAYHIEDRQFIDDLENFYEG